MLAHFKHIDSIPDDPREWGIVVPRAASLAATLARDRQLALLFRHLATLRTDVPVFESVDDLEWRGPTLQLPDFRRRVQVKTA